MLIQLSVCGCACHTLHCTARIKAAWQHGYMIQEGGMVCVYAWNGWSVHLDFIPACLPACLHGVWLRLHSFRLKKGHIMLWHFLTTKFLGKDVSCLKQKAQTWGQEWTLWLDLPRHSWDWTPTLCTQRPAFPKKAEQTTMGGPPSLHIDCYPTPHTD